MKQDGRPSVAVLGAGLIGVDLVSKAVRSDVLDFRLLVGRDERTPGLRQAARMGLGTSAEGIRALTEAEEPFDIVFDATNAMSHALHAELLAPLGTMLIDLTPSKVGRMVVPTVNGLDATGFSDVNMVSCGGQASIPILHAVSRRHRLDYVEVVTTAASLSVGRSTRLNLDEYVGTTQDAVRDFTGAKEVKSILNISPARPPATFRVSMSLHGDKLTRGSVGAAVEEAVAAVRAFVGGYRVTACTVNDGTAFIAVEVTAHSDRIPKHAGNIDIINSAALHVAEQYARSNRPAVEKESA
ncbi:acetaldehyde dehydrogenase (acetylating) [Streptomyces sp. V2I9]|uniref:acetaldehyde dehydrogenase (acetylating) n=1 Tax=Streptomyces sp. V2I9 TaxID=3042304 RepID=UPI002787C8E9|nr:acetaldehyde dehydrogenase (acetylating) [Streptomyces sp. V2I9]MDQ0988747.1 acetaldehyde dehydrogenase [Streptomyces sp. V2I9]